MSILSKSWSSKYISEQITTASHINVAGSTPKRAKIWKSEYLWFSIHLEKPRQAAEPQKSREEKTSIFEETMPVNYKFWEVGIESSATKTVDRKTKELDDSIASQKSSHSTMMCWIQGIRVIGLKCNLWGGLTCKALHEDTAWMIMDQWDWCSNSEKSCWVRYCARGPRHELYK